MIGIGLGQSSPRNPWAVNASFVSPIETTPNGLWTSTRGQFTGATLGDWKTSPNGLYCVNLIDGSNLLADAGSPNHIIEAGFKRIAASNYSGIVFRATDKNSYIDEFNLWSNQNNSLQIQKVVAGTGTIIGSAAVTFIDDLEYYLRIELIGQNIKVYVDGVMAINVDDSFNADKTHFGPHHGGSVAGAHWTYIRGQRR